MHHAVRLPDDFGARRGGHVDDAGLAALVEAVSERKFGLPEIAVAVAALAGAWMIGRALRDIIDAWIGSREAEEPATPAQAESVRTAADLRDELDGLVAELSDLDTTLVVLHDDVRDLFEQRDGEGEARERLAERLDQVDRNIDTLSDAIEDAGESGDLTRQLEDERAAADTLLVEISRIDERMAAIQYAIDGKLEVARRAHARWEQASARIEEIRAQFNALA